MKPCNCCRTSSAVIYTIQRKQKTGLFVFFFSLAYSLGVLWMWRGEFARGRQINKTKRGKETWQLNTSKMSERRQAHVPRTQHKGVVAIFFVCRLTQIFRRCCMRLSEEKRSPHYCIEGGGCIQH